MTRTQTEIIYRDLSYKLVGLFYKVQDTLGRYARESQYSSFLEKLLKESDINYEKEKLISKTGSDINRADFVVENSVVLELKAKPFLTRDDFYQTLRYLEFANIQLGLLVNFRQKFLKPKRILNPKFV